MVSIGEYFAELLNRIPHGFVFPCCVLPSCCCCCCCCGKLEFSEGDGKFGWNNRT